MKKPQFHDLFDEQILRMQGWAEFRCDLFFEVLEVNRSFSWAQSEEIWRDTLMLAFQMPNGSSPQRWRKGLAD